ncbi:MAG TPA: zinc-dependent metalloprotease [Enteractinococcus sp.]
MQIFSQKVAASTGRNLVPPGPRVPATDAIIETEALRAAAYDAAEHVATLSKLTAVQHWADQPVDHDVEVLVVDRPGWITANSHSLQVMLEPAFNRLSQVSESLMKSLSSDVTASFSGAQVGAVLAFLSTKILGQFEPYAAQAAGGDTKPRLMLVAPNVMMIRDELKLDPEDFRFWVSLHELTHVAQFAQAPWLSQHILDIATDFLLTNILPDSEHNLTATQKAAKTKELESQITGVMSLLEGHANVIMDAVDRKLVPSVRTIRKRFDDRSANHNWLTQLLRKLFGLDAKAKQYKQGQAFVAAVIDRVGMEQFNLVWEASENLPSMDELTDADAWIARVLH